MKMCHLNCDALKLVPYNISVYRIDIECAPNIDYKYLLKPTQNNIEYQYQITKCKNWFNFKDIEQQFDEIYAEVVVFVAFDGSVVVFLRCSHLTNYINKKKSNLKEQISNRTPNADIVQH